MQGIQVPATPALDPERLFRQLTSSGQLLPLSLRQQVLTWARSKIKRLEPSAADGGTAYLFNRDGSPTQVWYAIRYQGALPSCSVLRYSVLGFLVCGLWVL